MQNTRILIGGVFPGIGALANGGGLDLVIGADRIRCRKKLEDTTFALAVINSDMAENAADGKGEVKDNLSFVQELKESYPQMILVTLSEDSSILNFLLAGANFAATPRTPELVPCIQRLVAG